LLTEDERSTSKPAVALLNIYDLTRDRKYLDQAKEIVEGFNAIAGDVLKEFQGEPPFRTWWLYHGDFWYHVQDLLVRYHNATGDESTLATLMKTVDLHLRDSWDSEREGWCVFDNQPFVSLMRKLPGAEPRIRGPYSTEFGLSFAYAARMTGDMGYLAPFLENLEELDGLSPGQSWQERCGNRYFTRSQWLFVPFISLLPQDWPAKREKIVLQEAFRAGLKQEDGLAAWSPKGKITPTLHGELAWTESPFGKVVRTHGQNWVSYKTPQDILALPGSLSFWVKKGEATWGRRPWPWYTELRGLVHIADAGSQTNALDLMCVGNDLWTRLYDQRGWDTVALSASFPWNDGKWHHVAVVWTRLSLTVYVDGNQAARSESSTLPDGGQKTIHIGYRPGNWYGQAGFHDVRIFRTALPARRVKEIYEEKRH